MESKELIESGQLELYVFGLLTESESAAIALLEKSDPNIRKEILSIEKAMIELSTSFSKDIKSEIYDKIKSEILPLNKKSVDIHSKNYFNFKTISAIAAALAVVIFGLHYYQKYNDTNHILTQEMPKLNKKIEDLDTKNKLAKNIIDILKDSKNKIVELAGQTISPNSYAKVYWNESNKKVYVVANGLPEPPEGMVYQVWALKLNPLTPTSIGLLDNFKSNDLGFFELEPTENPEAFGITLEPSGGSISPTMNQLYTLGKI